EVECELTPPLYVGVSLRWSWRQRSRARVPTLLQEPQERSPPSGLTSAVSEDWISAPCGAARSRQASSHPPTRPSRCGRGTPERTPLFGELSGRHTVAHQPILRPWKRSTTTLSTPG